MLFSEGSNSVSKELMVGEGGKQHNTSSLMFLCDLAHKYIINFII